MKTIAAFLISCICVWAFDQPHGASKGNHGTVKAPLRISCVDIGRTVVISGKLDRPLGTMLTITGECVPEPKPNAKANIGKMFFAVHSMDGAIVKDTVLLNVESFFKVHLALDLGKRYRLKGYEIGGFRGTPGEAFDEYMKNGGGPFASPEFHFATEYVVIKAEPLR